MRSTPVQPHLACAKQQGPGLHPHQTQSSTSQSSKPTSSSNKPDACREQARSHEAPKPQLKPPRGPHPPRYHHAQIAVSHLSPPTIGGEFREGERRVRDLACVGLSPRTARETGNTGSQRAPSNIDTNAFPTQVRGPNLLLRGTNNNNPYDSRNLGDRQLGISSPLAASDSSPYPWKKFDEPRCLSKACGRASPPHTLADLRANF